MTGIFWKRLAAMGTGVSGASLLGALVLALTRPSLPAVDPVPVRNLSRIELALPAAERFREQVLASLKQSALPEWCGSYDCSTGGYGGRHLDLGPDGFYYEVTVDYGPPDQIELAYGK